MRLNSITVRNYRIHRDRTVQLDPSLTLIGGPNEAGKSTLVEAAHRALFLKAKGTGEAYKAMTSRIADGHPEVEVEFSAGGQTYRIFKKFSGNNGVARLSVNNVPKFQGEEAEAELASILGIEAVSGGRGAGDRAALQWAHLWVWQGQSGDNPAAHATAQQELLLSRLQYGSGAVVLQSDRDAQIAQRFSDLDSENFTARKVAKRGSNLAEAERILKEIEAARTQVAERCTSLEQAIKDFQAADSAHRDSTTALNSLKPQLAVARSELRKAEELSRQAESLHDACKRAKRELDEFVKDHTTINDLRESLFALQDKLSPLTLQKAELERAAIDAEHEYGKTDKAHDESVSETAKQRLTEELARSVVDRFNTEEEMTLCQRRRNDIKDIRDRIERLEHDKSQLPELSKAKIERFRETEQRRTAAEAALGAMATGVELVCTDQRVVLAGCDLNQGEVRVLSEPTEILIGTAVRLMLRPGGGENLANAREELRALENDLMTELGSLGLATVTDAERQFADLEKLTRDLKADRKSLNSLDPDSVETRFEKLNKQYGQLTGQITRLASLVESFIMPVGQDDAEDLWRKCQRELDAADTKVEITKGLKDLARTTWQTASTSFSNLQSRMRDKEEQAEKDRIRLQQLEATHGDHTARTTTIAIRKESLEREEQSHRDVLGKIASLDPGGLKDLETRLERSVAGNDLSVKSAEISREVARHKLTNDGSVDPYVELKLADSRLENARDRFRSADRAARAVSLLNALFQQEQKSLAEQFTQPFVRKIGDYLRRMFGHSIDVRLQFEKSEFAGLELVRKNSQTGAIEFDTLSAGAREQLAAAVRLAMAEILAEGHDGCLPVIFDDAFAYSDPERVQSLQGMLDLAASRGLQVIVLTCNPTDYAALGAKQILLIGSGGTESQRARNAPPET